MKFHQLLPGLVCVVLLGGCASTGPTVARAPTTVKAAMSEADAAALSGHPDKAFALMKQAADAFPRDKTPWVRMAQMRFDSSNYGDAIAHALEALRRDPDDTLANSIVAVSGLRLSSKALADLTRKNNLSGSVRSEAQDLAKLLRSSLGEEVLVPGARPPVKAAPKRVAATAPGANSTAPLPAATAPSAKPSTSADPFGALK